MTDPTSLAGLLVAGMAFVAVGIATLHVRLSSLDRHLDGLSRAEAKIDALLKGEGNHILAIKRYREAAAGGRRGVRLSAAGFLAVARCFFGPLILTPDANHGRREA